MSQIKVSIAGITGRVGRLLTAELLKKDNVTIHGICRDPSKVPSDITSHSNVKLFQANSNESKKIQDAVRGTEICVCCYFGDDSIVLDGQKALIDACIAEGVSRFVASNWSFDFRGLKLGEIPPKDFQLHIAKYLDQHSDQIRGVYILNGAFMEVMFNPFLQTYDGSSHTLEVWGTGDEKWEVMSLPDAAKYTAEVVANPKASGYFKVLGDRISQKDVAAAYEKVYGQKLQLKMRGTLKELHEEVDKKKAEEPDNPGAWYGQLLYLYSINGVTALGALDNKQFDLEPKTMEDFFKANSPSNLPNLM